MTIALDTDLLYARFRERWALVPNAPPVIYLNQPAAEKPLGAPWARFSVQPGVVGLMAFYPPETRRVARLGRAEVQCFVPRGTGTAELDRLTDEACRTLAWWRSGDLRCYGPEVSTIDDDLYLARRVSFMYESLRLEAA